MIGIADWLRVQAGNAASLPNPDSGHVDALHQAANELDRRETMLEQCLFLLTMLHPDHHGEMTDSEVASLFGATLNMLEDWKDAP